MPNNLVTPKQLFIIGGGVSLKEGISKGLWDKLQNHFVIGINYSYLYYPNPTIQTFADIKFYEEESKKRQFKKLSLIVGKRHKIKILPNTIMLRTNSKYKRDLLEGVYKSSLTGLFALSLGIYLLDEGEIFLLGFDYRAKTQPTILPHTSKPINLIVKDKKGRPLTHFYQGEISHRGIGKTSYYNGKGRAEKDFKPFEKEKKIKIINVSLESRIDVFPKISYDTFFSMLGKDTYNQDIIRKCIKNKLEKLK